MACTKPITKKMIQEVLLTALENLNADELKRFQWHLIQGTLDGHPTIPKVKLENTTVQETVNQVMQTYDDQVAVKVTEVTLKRMNQNQLARRLKEGLGKGFLQGRVELNTGDALLE